MKRLFIANRGEICRRIAVTARTLGIETVTLASHNPPRFLSEVISEFITVEDLKPSHYLDLDFILQLAKKHNCDAIHPGYGFASEQAAFVEKSEQYGVTWVGPQALAVRVMADKATARTKAIEAGVPCSIGVELKTHDDKTIAEAAKKIGFPMLIKAAFGGGGRGMRRVETLKELKDQLPKATKEAEQFFGDGTLILESYLTKARHIEVQILGDKNGNVLVIGDRDCSMQRRHQKVIEEAPAPGLPEDIRDLLHKSSLKLAKAVNYESAGTIEFLVALEPEPRCFFLEMNTRLQVEHPVTEEVYGLDLVEWQLRIAQGQSLPATPPLPRGHAIEVRIYAEDQEFRPTPGPIHSFQPYLAPGVRWDVGVEQGQTISTQFDPMIAKIISYGESRESSISRMQNALKNTVLAGTEHNIDMLQALLDEEDFRSLKFSTQFIQENHSEIKKNLTKKHQEHEEKASQIFELIHHQGPRTLTPIEDASHILRTSFFPEKKINSINSRQIVQTQDKCWEESGRWESSTSANSIHYRAAHYYHEQGFTVCVQLEGEHYYFHATSSTQHQESNDFDGLLRAPVPGIVTAVKAVIGDNIKEGELLMSLESMKIECEVRAPMAGIIQEIFVKMGDQLKPDQALISIDISTTLLKEKEEKC